jgi:hypothetical protein
MDFRNSKLELTVIIFAGLFLIGVFGFFRMFGSSSHIETENDVVYEMPRPIKSEIETEFTLGDRDVIREYVQHKEKNKKVQAPPKKNVPGQVKPTVGIANAGYKNPADYNRKPKVEITEAVQRADHRMSDSGEAYTGPTQISQPNLAQTKAQEQPPKDDDKKVKTLDEWKQLLLAEPTKKNMNDFIKAWRSNEVEAAGFYQVSQALLATKEKNHQATALYGLALVPHVMSFAMIAKQEGNLTPENKTAANQILMSYATPQRLSVLDQALKMNDPVVLKKAAEVITAGLAMARSGHTNDPRQARGDTATTEASNEAYKRFLPTFQQWLQSGDNTLMTMANSFLETWFRISS